MCKYCRESDENGDVYTEWLKDKTVKSLWSPLRFYIKIYPEDNAPYSVNNLKVCVISNGMTHDIMEKKINYCPMCGRKL